MAETRMQQHQSSGSKTRTAVALLTVALVFFFGIVAKVWVFGR